ncbi:MAG: PIN domain-containing protein [Phycisphaerae bacterium]
MKTPRIYAETSVFGGVFDEEFEAASRAFFELVRRGRFTLLVSDICRKEISRAPARVRAAFEEMLAFTQLVPIDERVLALRDAYISAGIIRAKWTEDAGHVAAATVAEANVLVSWNFRHIVHFDKVRVYNAINALHGYHAVDIRSPLEVVDYEDEDV